MDGIGCGCAALAQPHPENRLLSRAQQVYEVYANRADPLASVRALLPPGLEVVGFMGRGDDPDISFWGPFFKRHVKHLLVNDSAEDIRRWGVEYAVVGDINFGLQGTTFEAWRQRVGAELVATTNATVRVSEGPQRWYVVRIGGGRPTRQTRQTP
jgi:hypothetical protein